jgi:glyoxalase family protein
MVPATAGIHHVKLVTGDAQATRAFYGDGLGLTLLAGDPERDRAEGPLLFGDAAGTPGSFLVFIRSSASERGRPGIGGIHHVALGTAGEEGLLKWKRRLTDLGVPVTGPYDRGYFTSIYFTDPDGQILEIATAGPGYTYDEPSESLGERLVLPPNRIVRGFRDEASIRALTHPEPVPTISDEMRLTGIHHVSGITDDLDAAGHLLEGGLGMRLVKRTTNRDDPTQLHYFWAGQTNGLLVEHGTMTLFGWPSGWNITRRGLGQAVSVAFAAGGKDLGDWVEHLGRRGFISSGPTEEDPFFRTARLTSHDGLTVEVASADRGGGHETVGAPLDRAGPGSGSTSVTA